MNKYQKLIIVFSILAVILLAVGLIFNRLRTPSLRQIQHPIDNPEYQQTKIGTINYTGSGIDIPKTLPIYQNTSDNLNNQAAQIANNLNIPLESQEELVWFNSSTNQTVFVNPLQGTIEYSVFTKTPEELSNIQNTDQAESVAKDFLQLLGYSQNTSSNPIDTNYYKNGFELEETTPINANIIELVFRQEIDQIPVATETFSNTNISIWVENDSVVKAVFPPIVTPTIHKQDNKTINFNTAVNVLERKQGKLIRVANNFGKTIENINLDDTSVSLAQLQFRLSEETNLIYPYIEFSGSGVNTTTQEAVDVVFIVPLTNE